MKKNYLLLIPFLLASYHALAQDNSAPAHFQPGPALTALDSIYLSNLPALSMPAAMRQDPLPPVVDNSETPYLRPVFGQEGASCGQACLVGYNFTYELDRGRNLNADSLENQYATHFTYNFMNGGNGWFGVSYFHSMEVLRQCGNMNCVDYGGTYYDDGSRWITGYDVYYNAMHNRIKGAYRIHTGTEEGIMTLKHWIYDHLEGSPVGGVASFYANTPWNANHLPGGTPEAGKYVVTGWYPAATHAMTIVGYNDSIRWDYNGDGQYTNDIDLNEDDVIDVRDWEIGGVKFVNSHGITAQDSGFCYMMYKVLAEEFIYGGVWNQEVHVLDVNETYEPLLTFKVTLKHTYREKIRVRVGITTDTAAGMPAYIMEFPIFNFQGANYYMQGQGSEEYKKTIEFGLDITPLYSYVEPGQPARYFLLVDENDPNNDGSGELIGLSLYDYSSAPQELTCGDLPRPLLENGLTLTSLVHQSAAIGKPAIATASLPVFTEGVPYSHQLQAVGGAMPYRWDLADSYVVSADTQTYEPVSEIQLIPNLLNDTIVAVPLVNGFPYFGRVYDTVFVHIDGYLQFHPDQLPYPYLQDQQMMLKGNRIIAPLTNNEMIVNSDEDDGVWYEIDGPDHIFRWKLSWIGNPFATDFDFMVVLSENGSIRFSYGNVTPAAFPWASGISDGDMSNYFMNPLSALEMFYAGTLVSFIPCPFPQGMELSPDGLFSGTPSDDSFIYDLSFRVTDNNSISSTRRLQFTSWPALSFVIRAGADNIIDYGDTVYMDATIVNQGAESLTGCELTLDLEDPYVSVLKDYTNVGTVPAGGSLALTSCFEFVVSAEIPDNHPVWLKTTLNSGQGAWKLDIPEKVVAPLLKVWEVRVMDGNNGILEPGESADVIIILKNEGHSDMTGVTGEITFVDPVLDLLSSPYLDFGDLIRGYTAQDTLLVHALDSTPNGYMALLGMTTDCDQQITAQDSLFLQLGKKPVLVIDLDPHFNSGPHIFEVMQEIGIISDYRTHIPGNLDAYQCLFICLGINNSHHDLTWQEGYTLAQYLNAGGSIYLESRVTWSGTIGTPVHDKFNIGATGTPAFYHTLEGIQGTFSEGIVIDNGAQQPVCMYWLYPLPPAYSILRDTTTLHVSAIAHDAGSYRTIGSITELGTLVDGLPPSTRAELILRFLNFFGINYSLTGIAENAAGSSFPVSAFPNPSFDKITFRFEIKNPANPVTMVIVDLNGRPVRTLANDVRMPAGKQEVIWDGRNNAGLKVSSGIYFYRISAGNSFAGGKLILLN